MIPNPLSFARRIAQFLSFGALNSNFIHSAAVSRWCLPVMNCEACMFGWLGCPVGMIRNSLTFHEFLWLPLAIVLGIGVLLGRFFCKILCPIGALVAITNKIMPWKLHLNGNSCIHCRKCERSCPMDLPVMKHQDAAVSRDTECILCHECKSACPVDAIADRGPGRAKPAKTSISTCAPCSSRTTPSGSSASTPR